MTKNKLDDTFTLRNGIGIILVTCGGAEIGRQIFEAVRRQAEELPAVATVSPSAVKLAIAVVAMLIGAYLCVRRQKPIKPH
jgi:hypothetical protein